MDTRNILWVDIETTGLDPEQDTVLEIAAILTDAQGDEISRCHEVYRLEEWAENRMPKFVRDMHESSGLIAACDESGEDQSAEMITDWLDFHRGSDAAPYLGGSSVHFDRSFLDFDYPKLHGMLHYRNVDMTSIGLAFAAAGAPLQVEMTGTKHRAVDDIEYSLALYREALRRIKGTR